MAADLWLIGLERLDEEADTNLVGSQQVQKSQTGAICERATEEDMADAQERLANAQAEVEAYIEEAVPPEPA